MSGLVTPRQVARAIEVSESSVKRWCDKGVIPTRYTAGGHRRIPMSGLMSFLRSSQHDLVRPEVLGLPSASGRTKWVIDRAANQLCLALVDGDEEQCRRIALDLYLAEHRVSEICDQAIAPAFAQIGLKWEDGDSEVYQERRGYEIALRVLHELRSTIPLPAAGAPLAIGGVAAGDPYHLATTMVELVLRESDWSATSLGVNLPFDTLAAAIDQHRPRLFWLSVSHIEDEQAFLEGYARLRERVCGDVAFVVGGMALRSGLLRQRMNYAAYCDNLQHLEAFVQTLRNAAGQEPRNPSTN